MEGVLLLERAAKDCADCSSRASSRWLCRYSPVQALQTAVLNGPRFLGKLDRYGSVAAGKSADLLVLDADPLKDIAATREAYKKYVSDMLSIAGVSDPTRGAAVFALESRIAQAHWSAAERREADKTYNPMSLTQLTRLAPGFPWSAYLTAKGIPLRAPAGERQVDVGEKSAFPKLADTFATTPVAVWRDYLTVRYLHKHAPFLPRQVDATDFAFYGTVLSGQKQPLAAGTSLPWLQDADAGQKVSDPDAGGVAEAWCLLTLVGGLAAQHRCFLRLSALRAMARTLSSRPSDSSPMSSRSMSRCRAARAWTSCRTCSPRTKYPW